MPAEKFFGERIPIEEIAETVGDDHGHFGVVEHGPGSKVISRFL
ncbi:hypothetical protein HD593_010638 [Nonomuraea rubra]|uniref:Uncharacterized protein n=1 Tax=Nonomuraea rubra TaxID=46180 RepID=A0A7X0P5U2_9ACTN|nr:hypothetical protein [Nonomuraea rubra]